MFKPCRHDLVAASILSVLASSSGLLGATMPRGGGFTSQSPELAAAATRASSSIVTVIAQGTLSYVDSLEAPSLIRPPYHPEIQGYTASGVAVGHDHVLTNYHVVAGGANLRVRLTDGRECEARVVGADPATDLAVLDVEGLSLPAIAMGSSDALRVGEWVLAIGSPFGSVLDHTVTAGIVSAKGRSDLRLIEYEDFIQTDAAVHPGNSGGALVNMRGELVGIIAAVVGRGGVSNGIAFAIPVSVVRDVLRDIVAGRRVRRGFLGVQAQDVTPSLRDALQIPVSQGALLSTVRQEGPAQTAGLFRGDVIVSFDQKSIHGAAELRRNIMETPPGRSIVLAFYRGSQRHTLVIGVGERAQPLIDEGVRSHTLAFQIGLTLDVLTQALADRLGYQERQGLIVLDVVPGSAAYRAGLWPGDLIQEVDRSLYETPEAFVAYVESRRGGRPVLLLVRRGDLDSFTALRLP